MALLIAARAGCQTSQAAALDANPWESPATRAALLATGDADALEAAALLTPMKLSAERLQLVLRAAAAAPARLDLAWLALQSCVAVESLIVHTAEALKRTKTMEDREAVTVAIGLAAAQAIPALRPLSLACQDAALARPEDLSSCRQLARALRHSDTCLVEGFGLSIARRLWPASSDEYRQAAAETRVRSYRMDKGAESSPDITSDARAYLELLATHRTEQEAIVADLVARGINLNPPAAWIDPAL